MAESRLVRSNIRLIVSTDEFDPRGLIIKKAYNFSISPWEDLTIDQIYETATELASLTRHSLSSVEKIDVSDITPY